MGMFSRHRKRGYQALAGAGLTVFAASASADYGLNLTQGVTPIANEAYSLHMMIVWICVAIGVVVFGAMFYSIINHRKSKGAQAAQFHESTAVEIAWTIVPFLILVGMAIPATKALVAMEDTSNSDLSVKVTAYQWKWQYEYLDEGIGFFSTLSTPKAQILENASKNEHYLLEVDHPLVVPVNKKVKLSITANDVIHAWWVPALGMKKDAIPGFVNEMWFKIDKPGTYRGQCAELCGKDHGFMPIVVIAKDEADYEAWVKEQKQADSAAAADDEREWSMDELMARGEKVYGASCTACHQAGGEGMPGAFPPLVAGHSFSAAETMLQPLRDHGFLDADNKIVMGPVKDHLDIVLHGIPGTAMQAFAGQLSDADLAAVITYERNAWGNNTGDIVQPADVKAAR